MFIIGNAKVIPNLSGVYKKGQELGVYLQVYNAEIDQTTLRPAVEVEYVLTEKRQGSSSSAENWEGLSDAGQRLTLARLLPTDQMPLGRLRTQNQNQRPRCRRTSYRTIREIYHYSVNFRSNYNLCRRVKMRRLFYFMMTFGNRKNSFSDRIRSADKTISSRCLPTRT
jgi:hypothetical protein